MSFELSSKRVHILVLVPWQTAMAIEQMQKANTHTNQPPMKYLIIPVELCKLVLIFVLCIF